MKENKEVYFEIILPKSSFLNYRLGVTKIPRPGETLLQTWDRACSEAEEWHKLKHPELYKHNAEPLTVEETELVQKIQECNDVKKLAMLKSQLTKSTQPYYMDKLKSLTNNFANHE